MNIPYLSKISFMEPFKDLQKAREILDQQLIHHIQNVDFEAALEDLKMGASPHIQIGVSEPIIQAFLINWARSVEESEIQSELKPYLRKLTQLVPRDENGDLQYQYLFGDKKTQSLLFWAMAFKQEDLLIECIERKVDLSELYQSLEMARENEALREDHNLFYFASELKLPKVLGYLLDTYPVALDEKLFDAPSSLWKYILYSKDEKLMDVLIEKRRKELFNLFEKEEHPLKLALKSGEEPYLLFKKRLNAHGIFFF